MKPEIEKRLARIEADAKREIAEGGMMSAAKYVGKTAVKDIPWLVDLVREQDKIISELFADIDAAHSHAGRRDRKDQP